jgi:hypothetical protein
MILGLVVGLVLVALPLYLWRRPDDSPKPLPQSPASAFASGRALPAYVPPVPPPSPKSKVKLSPFKTLRCADPGPGKTPPERCDRISMLEEGLTRAIRENVSCAPDTRTGAMVSVVMDVHFRRKQLKLYRGKSSSLPKARTNELFRCIRRAMGSVDWARIPHQHVRYVVSVRATYPPSDTF